MHASHFHWQKSSYSTGSGECVEVGWRKSSHSTAKGECVEVADLSTAHAIRDSKHPGHGALAFSSSEWSAFLSAAKAGEFDL